MTVCNMATDLTNPCDILYREVINLAELQIAVDDLWNNGMGHRGLQFPQKQFFNPQEKPTFHLVLALDLELYELDQQWMRNLLWTDHHKVNSKD